MEGELISSSIWLRGEQDLTLFTWSADGVKLLCIPAVCDRTSYNSKQSITVNDHTSLAQIVFKVVGVDGTTCYLLLLLHRQQLGYNV